ncbi:MAG: flagellar hook-associated protein FlgK [Kiritimatiellae bacterium]|nr:flagellar hook-associated protein FlgK [Kiritimatiellia bacterium]
MLRINDVIYLGRSAILSHQAQLSTTGHNMANVNTEGYHKQRVLMETSPFIDPTSYEISEHSFGTGVRIQDVIRSYNFLLERNLRREVSDAESHAQFAEALQQTEMLVNGLGEESLAANLQRFWDAWQDVANNADNLAFRSVLLERTITLTDQLHNYAIRLGEYRTGIASGAGAGATGTVPMEVEEVNTWAANIAKLNDEIRIQTLWGNDDVNDLLDRRDLLVKQISEKLQIGVTHEPDNTYTVNVGADVLVSGGTSYTMEVDASAPPAIAVNWATGPSAGNPVSVTGGSIEGWIAAAAVIDQFRTDLDAFTAQLITDVNAVHVTGYDLFGNPGGNFFSGTNASDIALDAGVAGDGRLIAAAATRHDAAPTPNPDDGAKALEIAQLSYLRPAALDNQTFGEYLTSMMSDLGARIQTEDRLAADARAVVTMLENAIQNQSGVNLDEEMIDMISAQRAFQAAARVIDRADLLIENLLHLGYGW